MCLMFVAHDLPGPYALVVAANRDELHSRPAAPLGPWEEAPHVVGGRDLAAGGTWLGVATGGRFAGLTAYRSGLAVDPLAPSRGGLVADFLAGGAAAGAYVEALRPRAGAYNGFNLLVRDGQALWWLSNRGGVATRLEPGLYGLSNALLDTPWPKVSGGVLAMRSLLAPPPPLPDPEPFFALLADRSLPPDEALPDTHVGIERERMLAPRFILHPVYGTRCSTVVFVARGGPTWVWERRFGPDGEVVETRGEGLPG